MARIFLVVMGMAAILGATDANAFCVYNEIDKEIDWSVLSGRHDLKNFVYVNMQPGKNGCCNWQNGDCNASGKRDAMLDFNTADVWVTKGFPQGNISAACGDGSHSSLKGDQIKRKIQAGGYAKIVHNPRFDKKQKWGWQNPPYLMRSYTFDDKLIREYQCPAKQEGKPGLLFFL